MIWKWSWRSKKVIRLTDEIQDLETRISSYSQQLYDAQNTNRSLAATFRRCLIKAQPGPDDCFHLHWTVTGSAWMAMVHHSGFGSDDYLVGIDLKLYPESENEAYREQTVSCPFCNKFVQIPVRLELIPKFEEQS